MAKTSNLGVAVAFVALAAVGIQGRKREQHEAEIHEHQSTERHWHLYYSAPSRQALRSLLSRPHNSSDKAEELLKINRAINTCHESYQAHTRRFITICVQNPTCDRSLRVHNSDGSVTLSAAYGLDGLEANSFISDYVPIRIQDIVDTPDASELTEQNTMGIRHLVDSQLTASITTSRTALQACQSKLALVDSSTAMQSQR